MDRALALIAALAFDALLGDPPNRFHPTAWMGSAIGALQKRAPRGDSASELAYGALIALGGVGAAAGIGWAIERALGVLPQPFRWLAIGAVLKLTLALRGLGRAAGEIHAALDQGDLPEARRLTAWHLVSRDTLALTASQISAAAVESVAESASDGVVAPLFYYALFGLPGALAYRFANTADSMLGYRDAAREYLGKVPARLDDVLNLIPARLTAWALIAAAPLVGLDGEGARLIWRRDHGLTTSPNAGHPMSAAAGALGVELEKAGHYTLGTGARAPDAADIPRALRLAGAATLLAAGALAGIAMMRGACSGRNSNQ
jgi:adenosylcobinamide-phosphate synthase